MVIKLLPDHPFAHGLPGVNCARTLRDLQNHQFRITDDRVPMSCVAYEGEFSWNV